MTYGWAIVVVLAAIGALAYFGVLSPQKLLPDRTIFAAPVPSLDVAVISKSGNNVSIAFRNNKGISITIPQIGGTATATPATGITFCAAPTLTGTLGGVAMTPATQISNGGTFILTWNCTAPSGANIGDKFSSGFAFNYVNVDTTQTLTQTGSVDGKYGT